VKILKLGLWTFRLQKFSYDTDLTRSGCRTSFSGHRLKKSVRHFVTIFTFSLSETEKEEEKAFA